MSFLDVVEPILQAGDADAFFIASVVDDFAGEVDSLDVMGDVEDVYSSFSA